MTCHNRREQTLSSLESLFSQKTHAQVKVFLVDDGSSDGTTEAVSSRFPEVEVIPGNGGLYWAGAMRLAQQAAQSSEAPWTHFMWLNDDTMLDHDALGRLLAADDQLEKRYPLRILVGALRDPDSGSTTYSGVVRPSRIRRLHFSRIDPSSDPQEVETINGNFVLMPAAVVGAAGSIDPAFRHAMGDFDYGLRARRLGIHNFVAPGHFGTCARNTLAGTYWDRSRPMKERMAHLRSMKGLPNPDWRHFASRHGTVIWPVYWVFPYVRVVVSSLLSVPRQLLSRRG